MPPENQPISNLSQLKAKWIEKRDDLFQIHKSIKEIDRRLKSLGLAIWDAIGLAPNNVKEDKDLYILPNSKLSKKDLLHKRELFYAKKQELEAELKSMQAIAKQIQSDARAAQHEQYNQHIKIQQEQITAQYQANQAMFFAETLFEPLVDWSQNKAEIYIRASKLIAVCHLFSAETDENHLWQAWQIVARARDIEQHDEAESRIYTIGAENFFHVMFNLLPVEMHGLKFLYDEHYYDRVDHYLAEFYGAQAKGEDESYEELLTELCDELDTVSSKISSKILANTPRFRRLAKKLREQIIREHTYVTKSKFYLSLIDDETWRNYIKTIENNISAVINKRKKLAQAEEEFNAIKDQISQSISISVRMAQAEMQHYQKETQDGR